jgi:hypothetical protein
MQTVFIVRPFGVKEDVDFDAVEAQLIQPALLQAGLEGSTTTEIFEAGNIREDMFRLLVTADLVVADLSIHNANVFYELGIRHGLRPRATFMLRSNVHPFPFDLQTDRYLAYDARDPASKVAELARGLKATVDSERTDSPVYQLLPELHAPDAAALCVVPGEFRECVERAAADQRRGDLRLLAHEARGFEWAREGLRIVGRAQIKVGAIPGAKETFEWLRESKPDDVEANQRLATVYQRLGDMVGSNQAIQRVVDSKGAHRQQRAEAFALRGRNAKAAWRDVFKNLSPEEGGPAALRAPQLADSIESYRAAYSHDLNHYYSGLNAFAMLLVRIELAEALPDVWGEGFDRDEDARRAQDELRQQFQELTGAVRLSLQAARLHLDRQDKPDDENQLWLRISEADFAFLTGCKPSAVAQRYREALEGVPPFAVSSVRDQLSIFDQLAIRQEFVRAALAALPAVPVETPSVQCKRALLFTGHMVDAATRTQPRFPNTKAVEAEARRLILEAVSKEKDLAPEGLIGIAGGACGGDILFHEICAELGIDTQLFLALPRAQFCATSVQHGGPDWVERFNRLCDRVTPRVLSESEELPRWLRGKKDYTIWQRNNLWMLFNALALNPERLTLVALWDGGKGDGPGGTDDLVQQVQSRGHRNVILSADTLKQFGS